MCPDRGPGYRSDRGIERQEERSVRTTGGEVHSTQSRRASCVRAPRAVSATVHRGVGSGTRAFAYHSDTH